MSAFVLTDAKIWMGGYDISGITNKLAAVNSAVEKDASVFGDAAMRRLAGQKDSMVEAAGFYDGTYEGALSGVVGATGNIVSFAPVHTEGGVAYAMRAMGGEFAQLGDLNEVTPFSLSLKGSEGDALSRGLLLYNQAGVASSENGTAFQLGAVAAGQTLYAARHVTAVDDGADTIDAVLASDDNESFDSGTTRITFTQASAIGAEWMTLPGPITDDWWRLQLTIAGTTPSFNVTLVAFIV